MNILIVEDEILIAKSLKRLFERNGHSVSIAHSGRDAIALILQNDFDRILCDLMLQDTTGFDVIDESKQKYSNIEIGSKFVIMTAYSSPQVLENAKKYNCKVLSKPFSDIHASLKEILGD